MLKKFIKVALTLLMFMGGIFLSEVNEVNSVDCTMFAQIRTATFSKIQYCRLSDIARQHGLSVRVSGKSAYLSGKGITFKLNLNQKAATYNSLNISLLFPATQTASSGYFISTLDYRNVILPLISRASVKKHVVKTICIDPGHGGKDQGAKGRKYLEKNIALSMSKRVGAYLRKAGYKVIYTRTKDTYLTLDQRANISNKYSANLFVSIHCNAAENRSVRGIETFCMTPVGAPSTYDKTPRSTRYDGNLNDRNNLRLCHDVHRSLIANLKATDRGMKHARFSVLRGVKCPGILLELGFISNSADEANLGSAVYQDKLAKQIANGIIRYHQAVKK